MKHRQIFRRGLCVLLSLLMYLTLLPTAALAAETGTGKAIQIGTSGISGYDSTNGYDYIYFGYWTAPDEYTTSGPVKWRVLDTKTNMENAAEGDGLFLLSDVALGSGYYGNVCFQELSHYDAQSNQYHKGSEPSDDDHTNCLKSNAWQGSDAQAWCKDFAGIEGSSVTDAFSAAELAAILETTKSDAEYKNINGYSFSASENILSGDKVFLLSAEEVENEAYGFTDDSSRLVNYGDRAE